MEKQTQKFDEEKTLPPLAGTDFFLFLKVVSW